MHIIVITYNELFKTATRSGRRREISRVVVKAFWQKRRSAPPLPAEIGDAGFYIEGCFTLRAATATPAEPIALRPDPREASAVAPCGARSWDRRRGAITKRLKNKIETDLSWGRTPLLKVPHCNDL